MEFGKLRMCDVVFDLIKFCKCAEMWQNGAKMSQNVFGTCITYN